MEAVLENGLALGPGPMDLERSFLRKGPGNWSWKLEWKLSEKMV